MEPLYTIRLTGMEFHAYHGCYELERQVGNKIVVDLSIRALLGNVAEQDSLDEAVNYLDVYQMVEREIMNTHVTIEAAAKGIIDTVKASFSQIEQVECTVRKIAPPLGGKVGEASVTLIG